MGNIFVGRVWDLENVIRQYGKCIRSGDWSELLADDEFWLLIDTIKVRRESVAELKGYVLSLLGEDHAISSLIWDIVAPESTQSQKTKALQFMRFFTVTRILHSDTFWVLILDRVFVSKVWNISQMRLDNSKISQGLSLLSEPAVTALIESFGHPRQAIALLQSDLSSLAAINGH